MTTVAALRRRERIYVLVMLAITTIAMGFSLIVYLTSEILKSYVVALFFVLGFVVALGVLAFLLTTAAVILHNLFHYVGKYFK